jgi:hypothetical protein
MHTGGKMRRVVLATREPTAAAAEMRCADVTAAAGHVAATGKVATTTAATM